MAKKITDNENPTPETTESPVSSGAQGSPPSDPPVEPQNDPEPQPVPETEPKPDIPEEGKDTDIPAYPSKILQILTGYEELYIDSYGGTFTVQTPPAFRSDATLYHNPYYKP